MIRINKYLADCGIGSRRKVEELILQGRISVNNKVVSELGFQVDESKDVVFLDGEKIKLKKSLYFLLNKPKGYITSVKDERSRKTVIDLINVKERIYPVGRLDYDTTGLLFLTNDGEFSQLLTHPGNKVPREYEVHLDKPLEDENKKSLLTGIYLDNKKGKFLEVKFTNIKDKRIVKVVCEEGRNRFVKRMFGSLGYRVKSLNRLSYAGIKLDIPLGSYRQFTIEEIKTIKEKYSLSRRNSGK
jgi:23S rRNA pseudouridine2605 synthase